MTRKQRFISVLGPIRRALIVQRELLGGVLDMEPNGDEIREAWDAVALAVEKVQRACRRRGL